MDDELRVSRAVRLRGMLNRHQVAVTLGAIAVMVLSLGIIISNQPRRPLPGNDSRWYYDLNTGELFAGPSYAAPPIETPSGATHGGEPAGVQAFVFSCTDCDDPETYKIAYLLKYSLDYKRLMEERLMEEPYGEFGGDWHEAAADQITPEQEGQHGEAHGAPDQSTDSDAIAAPSAEVLVRAVDGEQWYDALSEMGMQIQDNVLRLCETDAPMECWPDPSAPDMPGYVDGSGFTERDESPDAGADSQALP